MFYFSTYCANCFCLLNVASSVLLFNLLFQLFLLMVVVCSVLLFNLLFHLFLFNGGGEQCFTFQHIVSIVFVYWMWQAVFYFSTYCFNCFCLMVVVCSVLLFNLLFHLFCLMVVVSSVLLFNILFQLFLFNGGGVQCFTFQLIVQIVFCLMKLVSSVLLFNLLCELFFV